MHFLLETAPIGMTSLFFLYVFLPISILLYAAVPARCRGAVLLGLSLCFYALAEPIWLLPALAAVAVDWVGVRLMMRWEKRPRLRAGCVAAVVAKSALAVVLGAISLQTGRLGTMPLGLLIYGVSSAGAAIGWYRGKSSYPRDWVSVGLYLLFFPRLYAGPLLSYDEFASQLEELPFEPRRLLTGGGTFLWGAFQYAVLGRTLYSLYRTLKGLEEHVTVLSTWCMVLLFALAFYHILCGYCNMAAGLGELFGLELPRNFHYPYQSRSITDFFGRFNITLHALLWKTVYGWLRHEDGEEGSASANLLNLLVVGMLAGAWFGLRMNNLLWGVYLALFLAMEKYLYPNFLESIPGFVGKVYTICVLAVGFAVMAGDTPAKSAGYLYNMVRFGSHEMMLYNNRILYLLSTNWMLLAVACLFCTRVGGLITGLVRRAPPGVSQFVLGIGDLALLVLLTALTIVV